MSTRVQIVRGSPWKDAVIRYLEPSSPYRPWQHADDVRENDRVVIVFDTEPALVVTEVGRAGADLSVDNAIAKLSRELTTAVPAAQLGVELPTPPTLVDGPSADALVSALRRQRFGAPATIGSERPRTPRHGFCWNPAAVARGAGRR